MGNLKQQSPRGNVIFCEDIRHETDGKFSVMGIFPGDLTIPATPPFFLPKICLSIFYFERPGNQFPLTLFVERQGEDGTEVLVNIPVDSDQFRSAALPTDPEVDDPHYGLNMNLCISPFPVNKTGRLKVFMGIGDDRLRLGSLLIKAEGDQPVQVTT